jgi:hypothetical protein
MNNAAYQKSLSLLSHPLSLGAIVLLLLNDHLLRRLWPSWWTGKLGDFAWLFFIPFACAVLLAWLVPHRWKAHESIVVGLAFGLPTGIFVLANTLPWFHEWSVQLAEAAFGFPVSWRRDPSDLVALASTGLAAWFWRGNPAPPRARVAHGWAILPLVAWLTIANSAAPERGIHCLAAPEGTLIASSTYQVFRSNDGGASWQPDSQPGGMGSCTRDASGKTAADPRNPEIVYRYEPGGAIERSSDGGKTWQEVYSLVPASEAEQAFYTRRGYNGFYNPGPLDALVDPGSGNILFAMGYEGLLLYRLTEGRWEWAPVGPFNRVELGWRDYGDQMLSLIMGEMMLAVLFGVLSASMLAPRVRRSSPRVFFISLGWLLWGLAAFLFPPALTYSGYGSALVSLSILAAAAIILPLGIDAAFGIRREAPGSLPFFGLAALLNAVLFFFPFLLWVTDILPLYTLAFYLALVLGTAALLVEYRRARKFPAQPGEAGPDRRRAALAIYVLVLIALSWLRFVLFS